MKKRPNIALIIFILVVMAIVLLAIFTDEGDHQLTDPIFNHSHTL